MEKLAVFKMVDDVPMICGYFDSKEDAIRYLTEVGKMINHGLQHQLVGEYIIMPTLYFNLQIQSIKK
jgi:hypothetical protein